MRFEVSAFSREDAQCDGAAANYQCPDDPGTEALCLNYLSDGFCARVSQRSPRC